MKSDYLFLGLKNLKRRGIRSWLTLLGIIIGITAVVSLISLGDGLKAAVNSQFGIASTEVISVQAGGLSGFGPPGTGVINPLTEKDTEAIEKLDSVKIAVSRSVETVKIEFNNKLVIGFATNVPDNEKRKFMYDNLEISTAYGRMLDNGDSDKIVLGNNFLDSKKNGFGKAIQVGDTITISDKDFRVVGILKKKGSFIWDGIILINEEPLKELLNLEDEIDVIAVQVLNKDLIDKAKEDIEKLLRDRRNVKVGEEDFEVSTPQATLQTINSILTGVQIFIALIAAISILVGAIGIVNTMMTSVMERTKEIGIMKAIGAKNSDIFFQFFIEAGLLGFVGGIAGILIGLGIGFLGVQGINNFIGATSPFNPRPLLLLGTLAGSFLIGSVSGISPALKAAHLNPVEALRK
jgi:putative ABC transport system permease protein